MEQQNTEQQPVNQEVEELLPLIQQPETCFADIATEVLCTILGGQDGAIVDYGSREDAVEFGISAARKILNAQKQWEKAQENE